MSFPHIGALKIVYWIAASMALMAGALFAQVQQVNSSTAIWVALIMGLSSLLVSISVGVFSIILQTRANRTLTKVETQTNNMNTELRQRARAATTRADVAEGAETGRQLARTEAAEDKHKDDKPVIMKIEEPISVKLEDKDKGPK